MYSFAVIRGSPDLVLLPRTRVFDLWLVLLVVRNLGRCFNFELWRRRAFLSGPLFLCQFIGWCCGPGHVVRECVDGGGVPKK